jgi:hypothetical protein
LAPVVVAVLFLAYASGADDNVHALATRRYPSLLFLGEE